MRKTKDSSFVTLIYGEDVAEEQAEQIREAVAEKLGDEVEVVLIEGKQPVYYLLSRLNKSFSEGLRHSPSF